MRPKASIAFASWVCLVSSLVAPALAAEPADTSQRTSGPLPAVLLAPARPVFLRVQVTVDGESLDVFRERFTKQWFAQLDTNKDGQLDEKEAAATATAREDEVKAVEGKENWKLLDAEPADGKATTEEFRKFVEKKLGTSLAFDDPKVKDGVTRQLFDLLDTDHNGSLNEAELKTARQALARLDADNDETVSEAELEADAENRKLDTTDSQGLKTLVVVGINATPEQLAEELLRKYDGATAEARDSHLDLRELGLPPKAIESLDRNGDSKLDAGELVQLAAAATPEAELAVQLFERDRSRPVIAAKIGDAASSVKSGKSTGDSTNLELSGFQMQFTAKRTRAATGDQRSYFTVRFKVVDRDKNNYLDAKEFATLNIPGADFKTVDADSDNQIVLEEVTGFVGKQAIVPMNQVQLSVSDESRSLFQVLDTRTDGRLSPRELIAAAQMLSKIDGDKDGRLTFGELTTRVNVVAEVKRPAADRQMMMAMAPQRQGGTAVARDAGPDWFQRMDRNFDGDVSWKEFLGSRKAFEKLDRDGDGLLSAAEVEFDKKVETAK